MQQYFLKIVLWLSIFSGFGTAVEGRDDLLINQKVQRAIRSEKYVALGKILHEHVGSTILLEKLREVAREEKALPLLRAVNATKAMKRQKDLLGIQENDFLQTALFIETALQSHIRKGVFYLQKEKTGLPWALEYDPVSKKTFIVLEDNQGTRLGSGAHKVVTKAILYQGQNCEVVARGIQTKVKARELSLTKRLQGRNGLMEVIGCTKYKNGASHCMVVYSKLYQSGTLYSIFCKHIPISLTQKMKVALTLLKGLKELHKRGIVHRDISADNCLVNIVPVDSANGKPPRNRVEVVLADFGRAEYIWKIVNKKSRAQGHTPYTPPEGIFKEKMKGQDFYRSDVYALGCIFYHLFYGKRAPWKHAKYVVDTTIPAVDRYHELVAKINEATEVRREYLVNKTKVEALSSVEAFEFLVLRMVDPDPKKRGSAMELHDELEHILIQRTRT